ncbi:transposase [Streptomyces pacificus]|uniref:Transposase n=1 Tax=Streptomyces pacificus TaxID=2705029 RepID=A0A6A0APA0_9ACTN|nr:transposase [Streptomyces pacificus]
MGFKQQKYECEFCEGAVCVVIEKVTPAPEVAGVPGAPRGTPHGRVSCWRRNGSASSGRSAPAESGGRRREGGRAEVERLRRERCREGRAHREPETERDVFGRWMALRVK